MSEAVIELSGVSKRFGRHEVLRGLTLRVPAGKTYAFLGRNGAGKTTSIRMMLGLLRPDAGEVRVLGMDPRREAVAVRRAVGYLAEDQQMWGWMKVGELLRFMAPFYPGWDMKYAQELLEKWELPVGMKVRHLSKGQNVRLGLVLALAHRPRVVILDDPALGLDPIMRKEFLRDVVTHLQGNEVTVFFSSHLLYEVEPVADLVGILDGGTLVVESETEGLRERVKRLVVAGEAGGTVRELAGIVDVRREAHRVAVTVSDAGEAVEKLGRAGVGVEVVGLNLDEIFEAYVVGKREGVSAGKGCEPSCAV
jgi:ABC-2 type transport system ATP-binding protein